MHQLITINEMKEGYSISMSSNDRIGLSHFIYMSAGFKVGALNQLAALSVR